MQAEFCNTVQYFLDISKQCVLYVSKLLENIPKYTRTNTILRSTILQHRAPAKAKYRSCGRSRASRPAPAAWLFMVHPFTDSLTRTDNFVIIRTPEEDGRVQIKRIIILFSHNACKNKHNFSILSLH